VLDKVNAEGVPVPAILVTLACLLFAVVLNYLLPAKVFGIMMSILSFNTVWTWSMVMLAHFSFRRRQRAEGAPLGAFRLRAWPISSVICLAFLGFVLVMLGYSPDTRVALYVGAAWIALLSVAYALFGVKQRMQVRQLLLASA
jgi:L-asparagine transporter-like permease